MTHSSDLRKRRWLHVGIFVGCIYATLYIVRPLCAFLQMTTPFPLLINSLMIGLLAVLFAGLYMKVKIKMPSTYVFLAIVLLFYFVGLIIIQQPEEKVHFIEYGLLAYLVYKAVNVDIHTSLAYGYAFLLTSIFGWIDEGIQYLLPNRYYQTDDVILNSISGALGLFLVFIYQREAYQK